MVLHGVEEDLQDRDKEAEQQPDVDVLDLGSRQDTGQAGQHSSHHQHRLPGNEVQEIKYYLASLLSGLL